MFLNSSNLILVLEGIRRSNNFCDDRNFRSDSTEIMMLVWSHTDCFKLISSLLSRQKNDICRDIQDSELDGKPEAPLFENKAKKTNCYKY